MSPIHVHKAFLCLGSNDDAELRISEAFLALQDIGPILTVSHVYESAASPPSAGPAYLNAALCLTTQLEPGPLKTTLRALEQRLGRARASATVAIDVDICLFDRIVVHEDGLNIPHPLLSRRAYMAVPVAECDPDYRHPETNETLRELAARLERTDPVTLTRRDDITLRLHGS
ncbi:MAG TPA: 2-amino-4-hydroxy-6-hydroxymethyldihydropteridine diphosphokinase [Gemmatimonadaceae bacterium]|jgi:2-amino-4-hydroxy-6-hydroxymethyldihydropteridine diphosphokinase